MQSMPQSKAILGLVIFMFYFIMIGRDVALQRLLFRLIRVVVVEIVLDVALQRLPQYMPQRMYTITDISRNNHMSQHFHQFTITNIIFYPQ